ncbi:hypothetical protein PROFUN_00791 [Planoprotostelium fungivorum]|uniref:EF-hand domain-containing protein n=1 Tax=Planoprotostelium fungivorum TaxID=1890364 RepID=A0A2P6P007_9EUKA|nr:hypothetical protein PROFUN_00791 [Planoprotostelium fungivorum]
MLTYLTKGSSNLHAVKRSTSNKDSMLRPLALEKVVDDRSPVSAWGERRLSRPTSASPSERSTSLSSDCTYEVTIAPKGHKPPPPPPIIEVVEQITATPRTPVGTPRTPTGSPRKPENMGRKPFFAHDLLMEIDINHVLDMKREFADAGGGVNLEDFVRVVKRAIPHKSEAESTLVTRLANLFAEIDVDNDGEMTWEEFTSFIVKGGVQSHDSTLELKEYSELSLKKHIPVQGASKFNVRIYKPEWDQFQTDYQLIKELKWHKGSALDVEYIDNLGMLATSSIDNTIMFWDVEAGYRWRQWFPVPYPQLAIVYSQANHTMFSGGSDGIVRTWPAAQIMGTQERFPKHNYPKQEDMITSLQIIPNTPLLACGSLDSTIDILDINSGLRERQLRGHIKGVFSLSYNNQHRFLLSAGSDRDALVWNPMAKSKPIFRLKGHHVSLVSIEVLEGTPQIITADVDGIFKLWDVRTFECMQTFESSAGLSGLTSFTCVKEHNQVVAAGNRVVSFEYNRPGVAWLTMDVPIVKATYNSTTATILTAGSDSVKIWDVYTGKMLRTYSGLCDISQNDYISAMCMDPFHKKIIVGTTEGSIMVLNYSNGALLRKLDCHNSVVSELIHTPEIGIIISASWDHTINIHDELDTEKKNRGSILRQVGNKKDVTAVAYESGLSLIVCGTSDGFIWVWDFEKLGFETKLEHTEGSGITALQFLTPYPVLCSADDKGQVRFWTVKPAPNKYHLLQQFENYWTASMEVPDAVGSQKADKNTITSIAWNHHHMKLYTGDDSGFLTIWDMKDFFIQHELCTFNVIRSHNRRKAVQYGDATKELSANAYKAPKGEKLPLPMISQWRGHYATVSSLEMIQDPLTLLSAGLDKRVRVWGPNGEYCGTLRQSNGTNWKFPINEQARRIEHETKAHGILDRIEAKETAEKRKPRFKMSSVINEKNAEDEMREQMEMKLAAQREAKKQIREWAFSGRSLKEPIGFYDVIKAKIRVGNPELNKFSPNQPGWFPILMNPVVDKDLRNSTTYETKIPTRPKAPLLGVRNDRDEKRSFMAVNQLVESKNYSSSQIDAGQRLARALVDIERDDNM